MRIYLKLLILFICCLPLFTALQAQGNAEKRQKKLERQKEDKDAETLKKYQKAIKRHFKIQSKNTKKDMKSTLKKSQALSSTKKKFFMFRWFEGKKKRRN